MKAPTPYVSIACLIFVGLSAITLPASAQRNGVPTVGAGGIGCGPYLADRKAGRYPQFYSQWV